MAKSKPRSGGNRRPTARKKGKGRGKRQSFFERNRRLIVLGGTAFVVAIIAIASNRGPSSNEDSNAAGGFTGGDFHSLVADPSTPNRIMVGGHEGVAVSADGGGSWEGIESLQNADAMGWGFDGDEVYLGGHPGLKASTDGGRMFTERNKGLPATDIHSLGAGGGSLYAGLPVGFSVSTDGGRSWEVRNAEAARSFMGRILVDPSDPQRLLAPDMARGVVESRDGGKSWRSLGGPEGVSWISWDPSATRIIASGAGGVAESRDRGATWSDLDVPAGTGLVEVNPQVPQMLYAGILDGNRVSIQVSRDGGATWTQP